MAVTNHTALLAKLKKQVRLLRRREEEGRNKLHLTLEKMRKLGKAYRSKLSKKVRIMKNQLSSTEASTFIQVAADLERKLKKGFEAKKKAFALALAKLERKHAAHLTSNIIKKKRAKKAKKMKKLPLKLKK